MPGLSLGVGGPPPGGLASTAPGYGGKGGGGNGTVWLFGRSLTSMLAVIRPAGVEN